MTELVVKSVVLGEMLITGRVIAGYTVNNTPEKVQFFKHLKVLMDMLRM